MTATYDAIATTTLGSSSGQIDFTGISSNFTDLILVASISNIGSGGSTVNRIQVGNGSIDTGSNYSTTFLIGEGTSATSTRVSNQTFIYNGESSSTQISTLIVHFQNYSNTTTNKTILTRHGTTTRIDANVSLWRSTSAINQIRIFMSGNSFSSGSTFTLYGIKAE